MKSRILIIMALPALLALLLGGCTVDEPAHPTSLEARPVFASYVAIGNSLTAGFMDSGLMMAGQANSYPSLIAAQLGFDSAAFTQPWVAAPGIGSTNTGNPAVIAGVLRFDGASPVLLGTTPAADVQSTLLLAAAQPTPYHNLGVPGATLGDVFSAYSGATSQGLTPFFDFINRASLYGNSQGTATIFELDGTTPKNVTYQTTSMGWQAIAKGPSLLTVWIGNNDVLGGATGGNPSVGNMTDPNTFASRYSDMMQLLAGGLVQSTGFPATIVVANIPSITDAAYFITEATFVAASGGGWPWGYAETPQLLTFPVLSWIANPANQGNPIPTNYTLTAAEVSLVGQYVAGYNQGISQIVAAINASGMAKVGLADMNAVLASLPAAQKTHFMLLLPQVGGSIATAAATTQFSLDGVHPNNHGYGVVANAFLDAINTLAETDVPLVDPAALTWDPTYGVPITAKAHAGPPTFSPEVAESMTAIWR